MLIFPAIDLYDGKAVRLLRGDYNEMTVYSTEPLSVARDFEAQGAGYIHLVDLEGARDGSTPNIATVTEIARSTGLFTEIGGGIRSMETVERYLDAGVDRVILGTAAVSDPDFLERAVGRYGARVAVGADIKDGSIAIKGWLESSGLAPSTFFDKICALGVKNVIVTDVSRDGAMRGTNLKLYKELSEKYSLDITASGGVSDMEDVLALSEMGLYAAIIGRAYYTGAISLRKAIEAVR